MKDFSKQEIPTEKTHNLSHTHTHTHTHTYTYKNKHTHLHSLQ
jgi:hypothetical protein